MTKEASKQPVRIPADQVNYLIATAARAPSVHNTQPWRFRASDYAIDLYCRSAPQTAGRPGRPGDGHQLRCRPVRAAARGPVAGLPSGRRAVPRTAPAAAAGPGDGWAGPPDDSAGTPDAGGAAAPSYPPRPVRRRRRCPPGCWPGSSTTRWPREPPSRSSTGGSPTSGWPTSPAPPTAGSTATWTCGRRSGAGAGTPDDPARATASPRPRLPPGAAASRDACRSVTSIWAAASGCCPTDGPPPAATAVLLTVR